MNSLKDRLGNSRVMSACEAGADDSHKTGIMLITAVSSSKRIVEQSLDNARRLVESEGIDVMDEERLVVKPSDIMEAN